MSNSGRTVPLTIDGPRLKVVRSEACEPYGKFEGPDFTPMAKILVVEDDERTAGQLRQDLLDDGFLVKCVSDGLSALERIHEFQPDLVVLDIDLSMAVSSQYMDGLKLLEKLRRDSEVPVLMLTGTSAPSVKVFALTIGADDYLTKPFDQRELTARIRSILRRGRLRVASGGVLEFDGLRIDPRGRKVWKSGAEVHLTNLEFEILLAMAKRPGWVFSREQLILTAWKFDRYGDERVVDTHVAQLRKKIEDDPLHPKVVVTVRGVGYRLDLRPL